MTPIRCPKGCGQVFGETDGHTLQLIGCAITKLTTLHCTTPGCGGKWTWRPAADAPVPQPWVPVPVRRE